MAESEVKADEAESTRKQEVEQESEINFLQKYDANDKYNPEKHGTIYGFIEIYDNSAVCVTIDPLNINKRVSKTITEIVHGINALPKDKRELEHIKQFITHFRMDKEDLWYDSHAHSLEELSNEDPEEKVEEMRINPYNKLSDFLYYAEIDGKKCLAASFGYWVLQ